MGSEVFFVFVGAERHDHGDGAGAGGHGKGDGIEKDIIPGAGLGGLFFTLYIVVSQQQPAHTADHDAASQLHDGNRNAE